jgi:MFS transporter, MHS family, shikimate and dehydroshikimate transport protein
MVRLLHLRHRNGAGFQQALLPDQRASLSSIAAFATYAVGFFARPVGAAIFGHYGDRIGRKAMLATTIIIMGVGTFLIGLLPTYGQIGVAAPLLLVLLRLLQGIGLGGEWGGAVLMVVENAQSSRTAWQHGADRPTRSGCSPPLPSSASSQSCRTRN